MAMFPLRRSRVGDCAACHRLPCRGAPRTAQRDRESEPLQSQMIWCHGYVAYPLRVGYRTSGLLRTRRTARSHARNKTQNRLVSPTFVSGSYRPLWSVTLSNVEGSPSDAWASRSNTAHVGGRSSSMDAGRSACRSLDCNSARDCAMSHSLPTRVDFARCSITLF